MKPLYYVAVGLLSLVACQKKDSTPVVEAAFDAPFVLRYAQQAQLPDQTAPELTLHVMDIEDSRCPQVEGVYCFWAGLVKTEVSIEDQSGQQQIIELAHGAMEFMPDTVTVQANSRRYLVKLHDVTPAPARTNRKEDKRATFTVRRL